jgi:hypothetical protein
MSIRSRYLTWLLVWCLGACAAAGAQQPPLPPVLATARSVYPINASGDLKTYDAFHDSLTKWNHFTIAATRQSADIVAVLTINAQYTMTFGPGSATAAGGAPTAVGSAFAIPANYLGLKIFDAHTGEVLWADAVDKGATGAAHAPGELVNRLKDRFPKSK